MNVGDLLNELAIKNNTIHNLRVDNNRYRELLDNKNFWMWSDDQDNNIDTLVCDVVIKPKQLQKLVELHNKVNMFFQEYLDYNEEHGVDEHKVYPISITCARTLKTEPLAYLLQEMRILSKDEIK